MLFPDEKLKKFFILALQGKYWQHPLRSGMRISRRICHRGLSPKGEGPSIIHPFPQG